MGAVDISCKAFFNDSRNFADLINGVVFTGKEVVNPLDLVNMETERLSENDNKSYFVDISKRWVNNGSVLNIFVIENQNYVDYGMVVRNMLTEALLYNDQLTEIKKYHKEEKDLVGDEFLSGIRKADMLSPIITVVVYLGEKIWDGPRQLYDMLDIDECVKPFIYNFSLNLFDYHEYSRSSCFKGEVATLIQALNTRDDVNKSEYFVKHHRYLQEKTGRLIANILKINIDKSNIKTLEGDMVDMCKAWDDHYNNGMEQGKISILAELVDKKIIDIENAAIALGVDVNTFKKMALNKN